MRPDLRSDGSSWWRAACLAGLLAVSAQLAGCGASGPPFHLQSIKGLLPPLEFAMTDQDGAAVSAENYRGDVVLLYFGYTSCPDVCPTTLAHLAQALRQLGTEAQRVRVLFVTVDPARDVPSVLKPYLSYFGTQFVGLRGTDAALDRLTKRYRVAYHREPADRYGSYSVDHSSAVFVFDATGRARLLATAGDRANDIAADLKRLLAAAG
jgi:protein SCO1/2